MKTVGLSIAMPGSTAEGGSLTGSHEQIAEQLLEIRAFGVQHVQVVISPAGPRGVEGLTRVLEVLDRHERAGAGSTDVVEAASVP